MEHRVCRSAMYFRASHKTIHHNHHHQQKLQQVNNKLHLQPKRYCRLYNTKYNHKTTMYCENKLLVTRTNSTSTNAYTAGWLHG